MTSPLRFSTAQTPRKDRSGHWNAVVTDAYFPLQLDFRKPMEFDGQLTRMLLGQVSLSRLTSDPVKYTRRHRHIREARQEAREEEYLITIPRRSPVDFRQLGKDVRCAPGGFIIERGDEPYRFKYDVPNDLFVLKVGRSALNERVRQPDRFCARIFDATSGTAGLFTAMVTHAQDQIAHIGSFAGDTIGRQLLELLSLTLESDLSAAESNVSSVRAAHLHRIEGFIRAHLADTELSPDLIATACGISKRYLHDLFRDVNGTVSQQIRDQRLIAARDRLETSGANKISDVAYRFGFSDQAHFTRLFKAKFGVTPSEFRQRADRLTK